MRALWGGLPPLVLAVRLRLGREGRRGAKRGLLLAPVAAAERQDGGGGGAVRAGGRVAGQGVQARPDAERGCEPDGRGQPREAVSAASARDPAREAGECPRVVWGSFCTRWAVVCGVRAQRAFDNLEPAQVVFIPYLRAIEQIRKGDVETRSQHFPWP
jgi:hypothetical protein